MGRVLSGAGRRARCAAGLAMAAGLGLLAACDAGVVGPAGSRGAVGIEGGALASGTLEGTWRRRLYFLDDYGYAHGTETTWRFQAGGDAVRTIVTSNFTLGVADTTVATARWRPDGTRVVIEFLTPSPGVITLDVRLEGTQLYLAGQRYDRIA